MRRTNGANSPTPPCPGEENEPCRLEAEQALALLEEDQLVSTKERRRLGLMPLPLGIRVLLWGLRVYVVAMILLVAIQVYHALRGGG